MSRDKGEHLKDLDIVDGPISYRFFRFEDDNPDLSWLGEWTDSATTPYYDRLQGVLVIDEFEADFTNDEGEVDTKTIYTAFEMKRQLVDGKWVEEVQQVTDYQPEQRSRHSRAWPYIGGFQNTPKGADDRDSILACLWDAKRLEAYNNGDWNMTGILCQAFVAPIIDDAGGTGEPKQVGNSSASIWGIESDATDSYLAEICRDLMSEVKAELPELARGLAESAGQDLAFANQVLKHLNLAPLH